MSDDPFDELFDPPGGEGGAAAELDKLMRDGRMVWAQLIEIEGGYALLKALGALEPVALRAALYTAVLHEKLAGGASVAEVLAWRDSDVPPEARPG